MPYLIHESTIMIGGESEGLEAFDKKLLYYEYKGKVWTYNDLIKHFVENNIDYIKKEYTNKIYYGRIVKNLENGFPITEDDVGKNIYFVY